MSAFPLTLGYAGSVAYGYGEALVDLIPVLREVGAKILLSTPRPRGILQPLLEATDVVEWMAHRADIIEMWRTMQGRADVMILPYSNPAGGNELLYRTHCPSKLTEYLALGMPVIVSGPEFATGVRWARGAVAVARQKIEDGRSEMGERDGRLNDVNGRLKIGDSPPTSNFELPASRSRRPPGKLESENWRSEETLSSISQLPTSRSLADRSPNGAVPCTTREELIGCLQRLRSDGELRREMAKRAVEAGRRDFDPEIIKECFYQYLKDVCP